MFELANHPWLNCRYSAHKLSVDSLTTDIEDEIEMQSKPPAYYKLTKQYPPIDFHIPKSRLKFETDPRYIDAELVDAVSMGYWGWYSHMGCECVPVYSNLSIVQSEGCRPAKPLEQGEWPVYFGHPAVAIYYAGRDFYQLEWERMADKEAANNDSFITVEREIIDDDDEPRQYTAMAEHYDDYNVGNPIFNAGPMPGKKNSLASTVSTRSGKEGRRRSSEGKASTLVGGSGIVGFSKAQLMKPITGWQAWVQNWRAKMVAWRIDPPRKLDLAYRLTSRRDSRLQAHAYLADHITENVDWLMGR
jgi:hypothetical protein